MALKKSLRRVLKEYRRKADFRANEYLSNPISEAVVDDFIIEKLYEQAKNGINTMQFQNKKNCLNMDSRVYPSIEDLVRFSKVYHLEIKFYDDNCYTSKKKEDAAYIVLYF